jgi:hypothetical protein
MPSSFTWLDYSEQERRKMLDAIRLFKDQNTVDELGIGTVRDRFADLLFPGFAKLCAIEVVIKYVLVREVTMYL